MCVVAGDPSRNRRGCVYREAGGGAARDIQADITWFPAWYELPPELMRLHRVPARTDLIHANAWLALPFLGRGIPVVATVHHLVHDPAYAPIVPSATLPQANGQTSQSIQLRHSRGSD